MCGSVPKLNPPSSTFGQEILSSKRSISQSANFSATEQYCAKVCPQILTIIFVSWNHKINSYQTVKGIGKWRMDQSSDLSRNTSQSRIHSYRISRKLCSNFRANERMERNTFMLILRKGITGSALHTDGTNTRLDAWYTTSSRWVYHWIL